MPERVYSYKDVSGSYDSTYGQDPPGAWVLVWDPDASYTVKETPAP